MCRQAAFPPHFPKDKALEILESFAAGNPDGVGTAYLKDGKFVVNKSHLCLSKALKAGTKLLDHMPYAGWTIAHLRWASHGAVEHKNTHPFVTKDWAFVHNGVWTDHAIVKEALPDKTKFESDTDSEVAAHLIQKVGVQRFFDAIGGMGVILALNRDGSLWTIKTSGDLECGVTKYGGLIVSEFEIKDKPTEYGEMDLGWMKFSANGKLEDSFEYKPSKTTSSQKNDKEPIFHDSGDDWNDNWSPDETARLEKEYLESSDFEDEWPSRRHVSSVVDTPTYKSYFERLEMLDNRKLR